MRRALFLSAVALLPLTAGCGSADKAASACESVPVVGSDRQLVVPPPPRIVRARQEGQRMLVDLQIPETPKECKPIGYLVAVASVAEQSNRGGEPANKTGGWMPLHGRSLHLVLRRPILDLPPYIAIAGVISKTGRSRTVTRRLPQAGAYCLLHHPKEYCLIRAQYLAQQCMRAEVPRRRCTDWVYGSMKPRPRVPVRGAGVAAVRENLREVLRRGTYNDVRLTKLTCTARLACFATFARGPAEGIVRVRYLLSGEQKPGCWFASRIDVIDPPQDRARSPLQPFLPLGNQAWCLQWRKP
jgi:hypothetical protein